MTLPMKVWERSIWKVAPPSRVASMLKALRRGNNFSTFLMHDFRILGTPQSGAKLYLPEIKLMDS